MRAEDAADVLQEVFLAVFSAISSFRHQQPGDTFRGWLRTITRNKIRDHFRRQRGQVEPVGGTDAYQRFLDLAADESETSANRPALDGLFHRALESIRTEFEDQTWRVFLQVVVEGRPTKEVAAKTGRTPAAVRKVKSRVLRRLRQELGDAD